MFLLVRRERTTLYRSLSASWTFKSLPFWTLQETREGKEILQLNRKQSFQKKKKKTGTLRISFTMMLLEHKSGPQASGSRRLGQRSLLLTFEVGLAAGSLSTCQASAISGWTVYNQQRPEAGTLWHPDLVVASSGTLAPYERSWSRGRV